MLNSGMNTARDPRNPRPAAPTFQHVNQAAAAYGPIPHPPPPPPPPPAHHPHPHPHPHPLPPPPSQVPAPVNHSVNNPAPTPNNRDHGDVDGGDDEDGSDSWGMITIDKNCDQIRHRFNNLVDCGEYTITSLCSELGVSGKSYRSFMTQSGERGFGSLTYTAGLKFFQRRQKKGIVEPRKNSKKRKANESAGGPSVTAGAGTAGAEGPAKKSKKAAIHTNEDGVEDVSHIHLDGEDEDRVPVFDTCDEIRRKMNMFLRREDVTQAAFLRALHSELRGRKKTSRLQSSQLARFRQMKGANSGNTSAIFYAAYVYFEKLRLMHNKSKTKHREEMEVIWAPKGGFDVDTPSSRGYFCGPGEFPSIDIYGRLLINGRVCH